MSYSTDYSDWDSSEKEEKQKEDEGIRKTETSLNGIKKDMEKEKQEEHCIDWEGINYYIHVMIVSIKTHKC